MDLANDRNEDRFLTCLHKIQLNYPKVTDRCEGLLKRVSMFAVSSVVIVVGFPRCLTKPSLVLNHGYPSLMCGGGDMCVCVCVCVREREREWVCWASQRVYLSSLPLQGLLKSSSSCFRRSTVCSVACVWRSCSLRLTFDLSSTWN